MGKEASEKKSFRGLGLGILDLDLGWHIRRGILCYVAGWLYSFSPFF